MLTEAKNQFKISLLSIKYALEREMLNKVSFISNIVFMILNNASFIVQWIIIYSLKEDIGGYSFKMVMLLWALSALTYGISRFFFRDSFELSDTINKGGLDNYILLPKNILDTFLIQPKDVLLSCITSSVEVSAIGDIIYGYIVICIVAIDKIFLFTYLGILGGITITCIAVIIASLSFYFGKTENIANTVNSIMTNFATYPGTIFKGFIRILFYTILPLSITCYVPVEILTNFDIFKLIYVTLGTLFFIALTYMKNYLNKLLASIQV